MQKEMIVASSLCVRFAKQTVLDERTYTTPEQETTKNTLMYIVIGVTVIGVAIGSIFAIKKF